MTVWEIEYSTAVKNSDDEKGHWYNVYRTETKEEAVKAWEDDCATYRFRNPKLIEVVKAR